jgi:hypothetical protein
MAAPATIAIEFPVLKPGSGVVHQPLCTAVPAAPFPVVEAKPRVFLTTVRIADDQIWANGLFQNVYVIYKMLEAAGFEPWLLVDNNKNNADAKVHTKFRLLDFGEYMAAPFPVVAYVEMGMSCGPDIRRFFRNMGAKVAKLYLGNILNIDIETIAFAPGVNFSHHVAGELDEIWVSPHYDIHAEYAGAINGLCGKTRIAPYVWDSMFIEEEGQRYDGSALTAHSARNFVIMEPNISFQKSSFLPILAMEAYYRKYPDRVDQVVVINGQRLKENPFFANNILPSLSIFAAGKLQLMPCAHMVNITRVFRSAIVVQHQVNNAYNYSLLEWMTLGYPCVHNVETLKAYGYYYEGNSFDGAAAQIEKIVEHHEKNAAAYKAHAKQLAWSFSPFNPANMEGWKRLLLK